jgi:hypothetical protein
LNFQEIKKISSTLGYKIDFFEDIILESDIKTNFEFYIDKRFKITNQKYQIEGQVKNLYLKTKEDKSIKDFLPLFNSEVTVKNAKIKFSNTAKKQTFNLIGKAKFSNQYESIELNHSYNKKNKKHSISGLSSLDGSVIELKKLNYKKKIAENAQVNFSGNFIAAKYLLIDSLNFFSDASEIIVDKVKLNRNFEIFDLSKIKVKTYSNNAINNDLLIIKSDKVKISGNVFDAQPLLKSLFSNDDRKIFSKKFSNDIQVNIRKTITGTGDDVSDLSMISTINAGSYQKLILKGKFSKSEILEMSIYQIDKDKKTLQVISDRARPFIKHFDFIEGFEGGKLNYESSVVNKKSTSNLTLTDFKVSKVPALAKLLTLASLQGIADTLGGEGIRFDSFEMKSSSENNVMNIEDALAMGPAVSILLDGYVDKGKTVSLRGTLVPATKLNSIIASIPLLGDILVGKKAGEGVVGVSFKMKGPPKNIKTSVNPIKTLTPRFIVRAVEKMKKKKEETK